MSSVWDGLILSFTQLENVLDSVMDNMLMVPRNMRDVFKETVIQYALQEIMKSNEIPIDASIEIVDNNNVQEEDGSKEDNNE